MEISDKQNKSNNGATPWSPPHNADDSIFHATPKQVEAPLVRNFTGALEIGFSIGMSADINISALIKNLALICPDE
jgi:hypothetical protein